MRLKDLKIATQLKIGIGLMLLLVILLGALSWQQSDILWQQTSNLYNHPLTVRNALGRLQYDIMGIRLEFRNFLISKNNQEKQAAIQNSDVYEADAARQFDILLNAYLGPRKDIEEARDSFTRWLSIRKTAFSNDAETALSRAHVTGDIGMEREKLLEKVKTIENFASNKAELFYKTADTRHQNLDTQLAISIGAIVLLASAIGYLLLRQIRIPVQKLTEAAWQFRQGDLSARCVYHSVNEFGGLSSAFNSMANSIQEQIDTKQKIAQLNTVMAAELSTRAFAGQVLDVLMQMTGSQTGAKYLLNPDKTVYEHLHSIGLSDNARFSFDASALEGEFGRVLSTGQIQRITVPSEEGRFVCPAVVGELVPKEIITIPLQTGEDIIAIISLSSITGYDDTTVRLLSDVREALSVWMNSMLANRRIEAQARDLDLQNRQLQTQQEELRVANEELEEQAMRLQQSEEELRVQQEELRVTNEELEEKNTLLERKTSQVEQARQDLEEKAAALAQASKYKSEFLANMSHELRTPLNSLLLLSQGLATNREGNLTNDQTEAARIIYKGGSDLLTLINDILDLSKIEAGRIEIDLAPVALADLADGISDSFKHMAEEKHIGLDVVIKENAPPEIFSDRQRLDQIIRNLVGNAIKFTSSGGVTITIATPPLDINLSNSGLAADQALAITVEDTGIGIPPKLHSLIFEAFQQADGTTSRKYGGTGLGLSISRELATLLGGEIQLESMPGKGSSFTLFIPVNSRRESEQRSVQTAPPAKAPVSSSDSLPLDISDDREHLDSCDRVMLVIEDDPKFASLLYAQCHDKGFKCLAAATGESGLELADRHLPSAIILDLRLPGMDGWDVLAALKDNTRTRHIPVHIISGENPSAQAGRKGAIGHFAKPVTQENLDEVFAKLSTLSSGKSKRMLVIDDDPVVRRETVRLVGNGDVTTDEAETGEQALVLLRSNNYDCVVLDLGLPDMGGDELLRMAVASGISLPPVVIYTGRDLTVCEEESIREHAKSIVIKDVRSQERLLDEVSLFLHRVVSRMADPKRQVIQQLRETDAVLKGKKVLVVDDDMRTTFALARLLNEIGMKPIKANNGERALKLLEEHPDTDLVLIDVMMPVMDGYETTRQIRSRERHRNLPIIALTAKAMSDDRKKCLEAGANDYLTKPVDQSRLFSLMRVWLHR